MQAERAARGYSSHNAIFISHLLLAALVGCLLLSVIGRLLSGGRLRLALASRGFEIHDLFAISLRPQCALLEAPTLFASFSFFAAAKAACSSGSSFRRVSPERPALLAGEGDGLKMQGSSIKPCLIKSESDIDPRHSVIFPIFFQY